MNAASFFRGLVSTAILVSSALGATVPADFSSAASVPVTAASYDATGNDVSLSLSFAPPAGTDLTIVRVTGLEWIQGEFSNLTHGEELTLEHAGVPYHFVANYYGGDGNDLVLQWARGELVAWGGNASGQLGTGDDANSSVPVRVRPWKSPLRERRVVKMASGNYHTLALCADGSLVSWGSNSAGELGNGTTADSALPVEVDRTGVLAGKTIVDIAAGLAFSAAVCSDGTLATWGYNAGGRLGIGSPSAAGSAVPVSVDTSGALLGKTPVSLAVGETYAMAICSDGSVVSWGQGPLGETSASVQSSTVPVLVASGVLAGRQVVKLAAGANHVLALCSDGGLVSWGSGSDGRLGSGSFSSSPQPVRVDQSGVLAGRSVFLISAGTAHSIAVCLDGTIAAWGSNSYGSLGNGLVGGSASPVDVDRSGILQGKEFSGVSSVGNIAIALCSDGSLARWGEVNENETAHRTPQAVESDGNLAGVAPLAVFGNRVLFADGAIGTLSFSDSIIHELFPETVDLLAGKTLVGLAAGYDHSVALCSDQTLATWGSNDDGELGDDSEVPSSSIPVEVDRTGALAGKTVVAVSAGGHDSVGHCLALCSDGSMASWGSNSKRQLGTTATLPNPFESRVPVAVDQSGVLSGRSVVKIRTGDEYNLAICTDGSMASWGENFANRHGNSGAVQDDLPVMVAMNGALAGKTIVDAAAGVAHILALCSDGSLVAWGWNTHGSLGDGSSAVRTEPVFVDQSGVLAGKTITGIGIRGMQSLAICSDGTMAAWGSLPTGFPLLPNDGAGGVDAYKPAEIDLSSLLNPGDTPRSFATSAENLLIRTVRGNLIAAGSYIVDQTGIGPAGPLKVIGRVNQSGILFGKRATAVAVGGYHALAWAARGELIASVSSSEGDLPAPAADGTISMQVAKDVESIILTPVTYDPAAVVTLRGETLASGATSSAMPLLPGTNRFEMRVVSSTGELVDYVVEISRPLPAWDTTLVSLSCGAGALSPEFDSASSEYSLSVPYEVTETTFSAAVTDAGATIAFQGVPLASGSTSSPVPLPVGATPFGFKVTAENGVNHSLYTIHITRAAPPPAQLVDLETDAGPLVPGFDPAVTSYRVMVGHEVSSLRIRASVDSGTIRIGTAAASSGLWCEPLALSVGETKIPVRVANIAGDATVYQLRVLRAALPDEARLKRLDVKGGTLKPKFKSAKTSYKLVVQEAAKSVRLAPVAKDPKAKVKVGSKQVKFGSKGIKVRLAKKTKKLRIEVTAQDGRTKLGYAMRILRR